ncbi:MAG TPA: transcriptional regulator [Flavobacteriaceae bacterium]|nr:MAG: Putative HTH-type transcriptional regulator [Flavobacteriaceae bacterium]HCQ23874.1 transcriptional regulator [Flavobacteriaceae bacterium]|tara:strand:- start:30284 stop:30694 length:411 start_codon:yes stop_codon:yes gene_type:complete
MISKKCKYALKALTFMAKNKDRSTPIFSSEIASKEGIPKKFLEAILRELRNVQILQSRRGKNGGYRFNKPPNEIYLTEVMRVIDGPIALLPCVSLNYYAPCEACEENVCSIKGVFETVRNETLSILGNTSIQSLVN